MKRSFSQNFNPFDDDESSKRQRRENAFPTTLTSGSDQSFEEEMQDLIKRFKALSLEDDSTSSEASLDTSEEALAGVPSSAEALVSARVLSRKRKLSLSREDQPEDLDMPSAKRLKTSRSPLQNKLLQMFIAFLPTTIMQPIFPVHRLRYQLLQEFLASNDLNAIDFNDTFDEGPFKDQSLIWVVCALAASRHIHPLQIIFNKLSDDKIRSLKLKTQPGSGSFAGENSWWLLGCAAGFGDHPFGLCLNKMSEKLRSTTPTNQLFTLSTLAQKVNRHSLLWLITRAATQFRVFRDLIEDIINDEAFSVLFYRKSLHEKSDGWLSMYELFEQCKDSWGLKMFAKVRQIHTQDISPRSTKRKEISEDTVSDGESCETIKSPEKKLKRN
ncbi:MAG: hypothetical protein ACHQJ6_02620 [Candidatus Berkiellales bacterium]